MIDVIVAFLIAALSGMGVGSAGLLVAWLTSVRDYPQLSAQGLNLYFFLFSSSASLMIHLWRRRILWGVVLLMAGFGALGALLGVWIASCINPSLLRRLFGLMLLASGGVSMAKSLFPHKRKKTQAKIPDTEDNE
ncbi:MAG: sulfite exporter TauE/SafE family protein [Clostridiales bacterium]|nr:sulfite exporter TauE/SafE family protein [Clostridiales bacterium]